MSTDHTIGPWSVVQNLDTSDGANAAAIYSGARTYVADVYRGYVGSEAIGRDEQQANARLIAAAPDLLEALGQCLGWLDEHAPRYVEEEARAAIAKAEGSGE